MCPIKSRLAVQWQRSNTVTRTIISGDILVLLIEIFLIACIAKLYSSVCLFVCLRLFFFFFSKHSSSHSLDLAQCLSLCSAPACLGVEPEGEESNVTMIRKVLAFPLHTHTHSQPLPLKGHNPISSARGHRVFSLVYSASSNLVFSPPTIDLSPMRH